MNKEIFSAEDFHDLRGTVVLTNQRNEIAASIANAKTRPLLKAIGVMREALGSAESILIYFETQPTGILGVDRDYAKSKREKVSEALSRVDEILGGYERLSKKLKID